MAVNIDQSYYRTGTATVNAAGTIVTGQGTQWVSATRANDLFGTHTGDGVRILSVDSDTQLTLAYPWSGPAQVASDYEIQFTPYDTGYYPTVRNLLQTMTSGNVEALAGLAGVPDGVPVFTGSGTMEIQGKDTFVTPDPNGNLAELSAIAKQIDKFIVMGDDGSIQLMAISDITSDIATNTSDIATRVRFDASQTLTEAQKGQARGNIGAFAQPSGTSAQYIQGDGSFQNKSGLPISTATQTALNGKANLSGATFTGDVYSNRSLYTGGTGNGKVIISNSGGAQVVEIGVGVGTGFGDAVGYYTNVPTGEHYFYTNGFERLRIRNNGTVSVNGTLSKGGGTFLIDHPLAPLNKNLRHGFVEAPEYVNLYRGEVRLVNGKASVDIDDYFNMTAGTFWALNTDITVSSLQNQEGFASVKPTAKMTSGVLEIVCEDEDCNDLIAWAVSGRRKDVFVLYIDENCERGTGRFIPEFDKPEFGND